MKWNAFWAGGRSLPEDCWAANEEEVDEKTPPARGRKGCVIILSVLKGFSDSPSDFGAEW